MGDRAALDAVYASLYPELKRVARARLWHQGRTDGMNTTLLVHESFVRLVGAHDLRLEDRRHFFAYAAKTMRNIIIDGAREKLTERRGGGAEHVTLGDAEAAQVAHAGASEELVRVNDALRELETVDPELAELVEMRYFGGYSEREMAETLFQCLQPAKDVVGIGGVESDGQEEGGQDRFHWFARLISRKNQARAKAQ